MTSDTWHRDDSMAALARAAAERYGDETAVRFLADGEWVDWTFTELWERVRDLALGLIDHGVQVGDRVAISANTRVEFTLADLAASAAGAIVVPVYPSNSPEEAEWVVGNSGAKVVFCENASQVAKIQQVRGGLPDVELLVVMDGTADGAITMAEVAERGRGGDADELQRRTDQVGPDDACLIIYTSGTTGRPKGVVLTNRGFAAARHSAVEMSLFARGDVIYLYLPLAHVFAQLIQADTIELGGTLAFWGGDTTQIVPELGQVKPNVLPSVPRIFEKVYSAARGMIPPGDEERVEQALALGLKVRMARQRGEEVSEAEAAAFEKADAELFAFVRGIFGGNIKLAISGAAPIAPEILEFFYACGVPVMEGWGMTETTSLGTFNLPDGFKFGTIGKSIAGAQIRIAPDGEIEMTGPMLLREYWRNPDATSETLTDDGYLKTGDLGSMDDEGFVTITGRKKDIIITAGGKNLTPANLEGDLRRSRWISQAVMYGDRKPYPVALITLDPDEILPWAKERGLPADIGELARTPEVRDLIQAEVDEVNSRYAQVEQIKKFKILDRDFSLEAGEMTPSLKLKRNVVYDTYADDFESLYAS